MSKYFDIFAYLMGKQAGGGGGGGDITVESKSISANGTYAAPFGKAYSPVTVSVPASAVDSGTKSITSNGNNQDVVGYAAVDVAVPNSYAAGDEGKVVSNGQLVAQGSDSVTQNGTVDTTLINSLTVNVSGGGGYGYTKLAEQDFTVNTSSTSETSVGTINVPAIGGIAAAKSKIIVVRVRDKAGKRSLYHLGTDVYFVGLYKVGFCYYYKNNGIQTQPSIAGVYANTIDKTNNCVNIYAKYASGTTGTIDGTYHVEVYALDWPDGVSPYA